MTHIGHPITHIVVHYSATYPEDNTTIADIDRMHKARGWKGVGYHWFIRRDGTVERGRPENELGAHVGGQNSRKIGVCWAGGVQKKTGPNVGVNNMSPQQERALIAVIRDIHTRWPSAQVVGHKDLANTQCPGFDVPSWWRAVNAPAPPAQKQTWLEKLIAAIARLFKGGTQ
ncbi:MAG: N-acetylmuramoyl-L-alanine amidase [Novosphingobium sp.]|nr:N-acetylmuramoyl-L-alanine amidase [Novosphingobium sp.]